MRKTVVLFIFLCMNFGGIVTQANGQTNSAPVPSWIREVPPEDVLWGIGRAETESDGESILLAEDRARTQIARQLSTSLQEVVGSNDSATLERTTAHLYGSRVIKREKTSDGAWWCRVELRKTSVLGSPKIAPQADIGDSARFNAGLSRNITGQSNKRTVAAIPDWVLNPIRRQPEDMAWGLGAAKLGSDDQSIYLARERARRALAYSLDTEVSYIFHSYEVGNVVLHEEETASITSVYNHTIIATELVDMVKTRDGTWWVLLGWRR